MTEESTLPKRVQLDLSLEMVFYLVILSMAALLRFWGLGSWPLSPTEGDLSFQAWSLYRGHAALMERSPLLIYAQALIFFLFGANDASARVGTAMAGTALVMLPYLWRDYLGRVGALLASLLMALSPISLYYSRQAVPEVLAAFLTLLLVICLSRYLRDKTSQWLWLSAIAAGSLVAVGPSGYNSLIVLVVSGIGLWASARLPWMKTARTGTASLLESAIPLTREQASKWLLLSGGSLCLVITGGLSNLHGVQEGLIDPLGTWLVSISSGNFFSLQPVALLALLGYETLASVFGGATIIWRSSRDLLLAFLVWWTVTSFILMLAFGQVSLLFLVLLPLLLLASVTLSRLISELRPYLVLSRVALFLLLLLPPLLLVWFALNHFTLPGQRLGWEIILAILGLLMAAIGLAWWWFKEEIVPLGGLLLFGLLFTLHIHHSLGLNTQPTAATSTLLTRRVTSQDVRALTRQTDDVLAAAPAGMAVSIIVDTTYKEPLQWYLRDYKGVIFATKPVGDKAYVIIVPAGVGSPQGHYWGQQYQLSESQKISSLEFRRLWRWWMYQEPLWPEKYDNVVLWVKV
ncbi:MAG: glycosyltransferase family 39 protein [Chloroflexi bacterium]|nr:glycosyltransferase family 39 protein [Chloroflexota bacterium]MCL5075557.1 glycosyltransferase family 39 protein [Chloroflexota bacterium]